MELEKLVKATYTLQMEMVTWYLPHFRSLRIRALIHVHNFPVILGVVQELFPLNIGDQQRWYQYGLREFVMPAFQCFLNTLANELVVSPTMKVFRAAQLFRLRAVKVSRPTAADVERIRPWDVPFKNTNDVIQSLKDELPTYLVKAARLVMPLISFLTPCNGEKTSLLTSHHGLLQYRKWYWYTNSHHLQQRRESFHYSWPCLATSSMMPWRTM